LVLLHALEHKGFAGRIALTAESMQHREFFMTAGADVVLLPFRDDAAEAADVLGSHEARPERASTTDGQTNSLDKDTPQLRCGQPTKTAIVPRRAR